MRLFVALSIPRKVRDQIQRAARPLREAPMPVRWIPADSFHVTLKFLGEVRPERVDAIGDAVKRVAEGTQPFTLGLGGFGGFPTVRRPRVVWLGIDATPALRCLKQDVEWALTECGFEADTRAFHPHLTLGRADDTDGGGAFRALPDLVASTVFRGEAPVRTLELMRSELSREGSRYTSLVTASLQGG